jgi:protease-4
MSEGAKHRGCGCSLLLGSAFVLFLTAAALVLGYVAGRHGIETEFGPGVGVLEVYGEILDERPVLDDLEELTSNPDVKVILVRVDSPGGAITAVEEIYNALERAKKSGLPVVASMGSTAASGGYFVCLAADHVFANRSSLTGSIGVLMEFSSARDLLDKLGVRFEAVASGEFKTMGSISHPLSEREREHMQSVIDDFQSFFVEMVCKSRKMNEGDVRALADGRVFSGRQALESRLVDELGDQEASIKYAANLVGLPEDARLIRPYGPSSSLWDFIDQLSTTVASRLQRHLASAKFVMR